MSDVTDLLLVVVSGVLLHKSLIRRRRLHSSRHAVARTLRRLRGVRVATSGMRRRHWAAVTLVGTGRVGGYLVTAVPSETNNDNSIIC